MTRDCQDPIARANQLARKQLMGVSYGGPGRVNVPAREPSTLRLYEKRSFLVRSGHVKGSPRRGQCDSRRRIPARVDR